MARDAIGKLREADTLDKEATKIKNKDPGNAVKLNILAQKKRSSAIRQMSRHPRRRKRDRVVL